MEATSEPASADEAVPAATHPDFPVHGEPAEKLRFLLGYAVRAPSKYNSQPWLFDVWEDEVALYADRTRLLPALDPAGRELVIGCGAALFYLRLALRRSGYEEMVRLVPDDEGWDPTASQGRTLLAIVRLGRERLPSEEEVRLFEAIPRRQTYRHPFQDRPVPDGFTTRLEQAAEAEGATLHVIKGKDARQEVAEIVAQATRVQWSNDLYRRELAAWSQPNQPAGKDGMPGSVFGIGDDDSYVWPHLIRATDMGAGSAEVERLWAYEAPVLAAVETEADTLLDWLVAGQALGRVLLTAAAEGLTSAFLNQVVELPESRVRLTELIEETPQILLRMGYPLEQLEQPPTPRRPVSEVQL